MATASGGEQIVGITNFASTTGGALTTAYTVPADRYALIDLYRITTATGAVLIIGGVSHTFAASEEFGSNAIEKANNDGMKRHMLLVAGQTIQISTASISVAGIAREYANP